MNFAELQKVLNEQETLAKSLSAAQVDAKGNATVAAAAGANANSEEEDDDGTGNGDLGEGAPLVKSFKLTLADGTEMEATDATEMVKALVTEIETMKVGHVTHVAELTKSFESVVNTIGTLTEGLKATREDVLALAKRGDEFAAANSLLTKSLGAIGAQGRGKRSADVTLGARPDLGARAAAAPKHTPTEILAKAESALHAGSITGTEATTVMTALNMGLMPEQAILDRIFK